MIAVDAALTSMAARSTRLCFHVDMAKRDLSNQHKLTAKATFNLVTTRTLMKALSLLGIKWSPIPFDQIILGSAEEGLYTWTIGRGHKHINAFDLPVAYVGIGTSKDGGLRGRLLTEQSLVTKTAGHAHGRAMYRLIGSPLGGPVKRIAGANISPIEKAILASEWSNKERGLQKLQTWLSAPVPDVVHKAEELCIRAAIHIGDTAPPLNSHHASAWASDASSDWGAWAVAQLLVGGKPQR